MTGGGSSPSPPPSPSSDCATGSSVEAPSWAEAVNDFLKGLSDETPRARVVDWLNDLIRHGWALYSTRRGFVEEKVRPFYTT